MIVLLFHVSPRRICLINWSGPSTRELFGIKLSRTPEARDKVELAFARAFFNDKAETTEQTVPALGLYRVVVRSIDDMWDWKTDQFNFNLAQIEQLLDVAAIATAIATYAESHDGVPAVRGETDQVADLAYVYGNGPAVRADSLVTLERPTPTDLRLFQEQRASCDLSLDGRAWVGKAVAYATACRIEFAHSKEHPGYYFYAAACYPDQHYDVSRKPVTPSGIWEYILPYQLKRYGLVLSDITWRSVRLQDLCLLVDEHAADQLTLDNLPQSQGQENHDRS